MVSRNRRATTSYSAGNQSRAFGQTSQAGMAPETTFRFLRVRRNSEPSFSLVAIRRGMIGVLARTMHHDGNADSLRAFAAVSLKHLH